MYNVYYIAYYVNTKWKQWANHYRNQNIAMFFEAKYFAQMESVCVFKLGSQSLMKSIS